MNLRILTILSFLSLFIYSCKSKKETTATIPAEDLYTPGDAQLKAIQAKFANVTAETLKEGHGIYMGACTNCHGKKNMYKHSEADWQNDVNRMAPKAKITDSQKDALWKYVLAMRLAKGTPPH